MGNCEAGKVVQKQKCGVGQMVGKSKRWSAVEMGDVQEQGTPVHVCLLRRIVEEPGEGASRQPTTIRGGVAVEATPPSSAFSGSFSSPRQLCGESKGRERRLAKAQSTRYHGS